VDLEDAVLGLGDEELEGVEDEVGAEPHVLGAARVQRRAERGLVRAAHRAVDAVGADDEVGVREVGIRAEVQPHAERVGPPLQGAEQLPPAERREAVAAGGHDLALVVDVDLGPAGEQRGELRERLGVGRLDPLQRLVGEDDAEAERVVGSVPFVDPDVVGGVQPLGEDREVEPGRASTHDRDPHGCSSSPGRLARSYAGVPAVGTR
jgi:hypothetical protein